MTHRLHRTALSVCLALTAVAPVALAQSNELQPGARVRVAAPGIVANRYVGTILSRSGDTLHLGGPNAAPVSVPLNRITSLEVSRGKSRLHGAGRGVLWGAPIGLVVGLATANSLEDCTDFGCGDASSGERGAYVLASTLGGALWGAGIGALVGRERWEQFDLTSHGAVDYRDGRTRVGVAVKF
jgi:hypothetical protein